MTYFVSLKITAIIIGLIYLAAHLPGAIAPAATAHRLQLLSRHYPLGVGLTLAATLWFVILTGTMDLGELSSIRLYLMTIWSIAGVLLAIFVPGFLPLRGLGCLLLLAAALILDAAFLVQTPARYVMTILAYGWAIKGMVLVYSPHLGYQAVEYMTATRDRLQIGSWFGAAFGLILVILGIFVYP